jgi:putative effector of murein hydrolase LrgA (UPF0299 family)
MIGATEGPARQMIRGITILLAFQLAGELLSRILHLGVPGPVIGFAGLVIALLAFSGRGDVDDSLVASSDLGRVANGLLSALSLLFVPAGVGVIRHLGVVGAHGIAIAVAVVVSTAVTMIATVFTFVFVRRLIERHFDVAEIVEEDA